MAERSTKKNKTSAKSKQELWTQIENTFIEKNNCKLTVESSTVASIGKKFKIPLKYESNDLLGVDTYTIKEGLMVKKVVNKHKDHDKNKLIL